MTNIGEVIGWKFSHQQGMTTKDGVIIEFPGGIPSQSDQDTWTAEYEAWKSAMDEILRLEGLETPRRIAESVLSDEGKAWLTANRDKIATERGKL